MLHFMKYFKTDEIKSKIKLNYIVCVGNLYAILFFSSKKFLFCS